MAASVVSAPFCTWLLAACISRTVSGLSTEESRTLPSEPGRRRRSRRKQHPQIQAIPSSSWSIFPGELSQSMGSVVAMCGSSLSGLGSCLSFEACPEYNSCKWSPFFGEDISSLSSRHVRAARRRLKAAGAERVTAVAVQPAKGSTEKKKVSTKPRRVVITGMGLVSCLGDDPEIFYKNLLEGKSGITEIEGFDCKDFPSRIGGEIKSFSTDGWVAPKFSKRMDKFMLYLLIAGKKAVVDAGIDSEVMKELDKTKCGILIGSALGGMQVFNDAIEALRVSHRKMNPFCVPFATTNMGSAMLAMDLGWMGPNYSISTACATSNFCMLSAANHIIRGEADIMLSGGSDAAIIPIDYKPNLDPDEHLVYIPHSFVKNMDNERAIAFERQQREKFARRFNRGPREYVTPTIARNSPLRPVSPSLPRNPTGMHEMNADNSHLEVEEPIADMLDAIDQTFDNDLDNKEYTPNDVNNMHIKCQIDFERKEHQKYARRYLHGRREDSTPTIATNSPLRPISPSLPRSPTGVHAMSAIDVYLTQRVNCNCVMCKGQIKRMRKTVIEHVAEYGECSTNPLLSDARVGYSNEEEIENEVSSKLHIDFGAMLSLEADDVDTINAFIENPAKRKPSTFVKSIPLRDRTRRAMAVAMIVGNNNAHQNWNVLEPVEENSIPPSLVHLVKPFKDSDRKKFDSWPRGKPIIYGEPFTYWGRQYMIKTSRVPCAGLGLYIMTNIKVKDGTNVPLMPYVGPEYNSEAWHKLSKHQWRMLVYGLNSNARSIARPDNNADLTYIDGRPQLHGNLAAFINSSVENEDATNCDFVEAKKDQEEFFRRKIEGRYIMVDAIKSLCVGDELFINYEYGRPIPDDVLKI